MPEQEMQQRIWTLLIQGPNSFDLSIPRHPKLSHQGGSPTIYRIVGVEEEVIIAKDLIEQVTGCKIHYEKEMLPDESKLLRNNLWELYSSNNGQPNNTRSSKEFF